MASIQRKPHPGQSDRLVAQSSQWRPMSTRPPHRRRSAVATEVKIPDIGDYKDVPIIEVHVKEGDPVNADDPLVSLESDKATMEVPAPSAGIVEKLLIKLGDKVSEGHPIVLLKDGDAAVLEPPSLIEQQEPTPPPDRAPSPPAAAATSAKPKGPGAQADFGQMH